MHIDNKKENVLVLGKGPTQKLDNTTITAEAKYSESGKRFVLSLHYNESNSFLFVNATKICQYIAKYSKVKYYALTYKIL